MYIQVDVQIIHALGVKQVMCIIVKAQELKFVVRFDVSKSFRETFLTLDESWYVFSIFSDLVVILILV